MNEEEKFTYCIGTPWYPDDKGNISTYAYGRETFYGNLAHAKGTLKFIQERAGSEKQYKIYKLVEIQL